MRRFKSSSVTCLKEVDVRKRVIGASEAVANMYKSHFRRVEMTSFDAKTMT